MSRRTAAPVRHILPDPKFNNEMLAKFMNVVMKSGKKSAAEHIIYGALDRISEKTGIPLHDIEGMIRQLQQWIRDDEKITELKSIKKMNNGTVKNTRNNIPLMMSNLYFRMKLLADFVRSA